MGITAAVNGLLAKTKTFDALRHRNFRFLWMSTLSYQIGMWIQTLVMQWLAYELTGSVFLAAMYGAARTGPYLLGPFTGALGDRISRVKIMRTAQVVQVVLGIILALLYAANLLTYWQLLIFAFVGGLVWNINHNFGSTVAMDIVGGEGITNAIALNVVAMDITRVIGPSLGGILLSSIGAAKCFWLVAVLAIFAFASLLMVRLPAKQTQKSQRSAGQDLRDGFSYVLHNRNLLSIFSVTILANIFIWPAFGSFMPVFAKDNLGLGPEGLGFLQTSMGVGALAGAILLASMGNFKQRGLMFLWGTAVYGIFLGLFAMSRSFPLAMLFVGFAGIGSSGFSALQSTLTLSLAPPDMRARCMGFQSMAIGILPFANLGLGIAASAIGAGLATGISCALSIVSLLAVAIWLPNIRRL